MERKKFRRQTSFLLELASASPAPANRGNASICFTEWRKTRREFDKIVIKTVLAVAGGALKVHKNENFFGFDFEFCTISMLVMHK